MDQQDFAKQVASLGCGLMGIGCAGIMFLCGILLLFALLSSQ